MLNTTTWCHVYRLTRTQISYCICRYSSKMSTEMLELPSKPVVGVCQLTCTANKVKNYETCSALIRKAKSKGAQMVFLPEAVDYIGESKQQSLDFAEALDGDTITKYTNLAQELGVWLSVGGFHQKSNKKEDGRVYNTQVIIDSQGHVKSTYSKTHLFDLDIKGKVRLCESDYTIPGEKFVPPVSTPVGRVGMTIIKCYDLRFPEYSLALAQQGAEILTYPSAFTVTTGLAHWEVLLRARAIETQCYVIAAAQTGKHNDKRSSYGHTMIIDPWGTVVSQCKEGVDVCVAEIDLEYLRKVRTEMPVSLHRRHDIYGHINVQTPGDIDAEVDYQFGQYRVKNSQVFYRSALSYAVVNIKPVLPGHVLVSPLRCAKRFSDLTQAEVTDLFSVVQRVSEVVERHFNGTSLTMAVQDGPDAGQSVEHVHVHILPRKPGDFPDNDDIYKVLQEHDKDIKKSDLRSEEEMAKEASILRQYFS